MNKVKQYLDRIFGSMMENRFRGVASEAHHQQPPFRLPESKPNMTNDHHEMKAKSAMAMARINHPLEIYVTSFPGHPDPERKAAKKSYLTVKGAALPGDYDDWLKVGRKWHEATNGSEYGFKAWCEWAAQAKGYDIAFAAAKWDAFPRGLLAEMTMKVPEENTEAPSASLPPETAKAYVPTTASMLLGQARDLLDQRARDYDKPQGERSMGTVAKMFNLATQREGTAAISESEAWLIMDLLKIVRDRSTPNGHVDSCEDHVSYAALYGEARLAEKRAADLKATPERETYQAECKHDFSNIENFGGAGTAKVAQTLGERVLGTLRNTMVSVIVEVKRNHGSEEALRLVKKYGQANRLPGVQDIDIPAVINGAYKTFGPKLDNTNF